MTRLFCLALMLFGLGACGETNAPVANPAPPTAAPPTAGPRGELVDCGEITLMGNAPMIISDQTRAAQAIACFKTSYEKCDSPAFLWLREAGTPIIRHFTINPGPPCQLTHVLQLNPNGAPAVADCKTLRVENESLHIIGCSHFGDFFVPIPR